MTSLVPTNQESLGSLKDSTFRRLFFNDPAAPSKETLDLILSLPVPKTLAMEQEIARTAWKTDALFRIEICGSDPGADIVPPESDIQKWGLALFNYQEAFIRDGEKRANKALIKERSTISHELAPKLLASEDVQRALLTGDVESLMSIAMGMSKAAMMDMLGKKETVFKEKVPTALRRECATCHKDPVSDKVKLMVCSKCKGPWYCSKDCQLTAWAAHKHVCRLNRPTQPTAGSTADGPADRKSNTTNQS
jgi:hypothetical protein